jgi:hypothetical protein
VLERFKDPEEYEEKYDILEVQNLQGNITHSDIDGE